MNLRHLGELRYLGSDQRGLAADDLTVGLDDLARDGDKDVHKEKHTKYHEDNDSGIHEHLTDREVLSALNSQLNNRSHNQSSFFSMV